MGYKYNSAAYKKWRTNVFRRDNFECQLCGNKGTINAHHIKRKVDFPGLAYKIDNGITLCVKCHNIITEYEPVFETLFKQIVLRKVDIDYVYSFFSALTQIYPNLVDKFKTTNKWLVIPGILIKKISESIIESKKAKRRAA